MAAGIESVWIYANNIIRSARQMVNNKLKSLDLSSAEGNVLLHLLNQGDVLRQEDIVEQLEISKPAVSKALDLLEKMGYVTRVKDDEDRRATRVLLTEKAQAIGPKLKAIYEEVFSLAAQGLSEAEIRGFIEVFARVSENFTRKKNGR
jgi:MarR family transcriptional regulator for hemolysin